MARPSTSAFITMPGPPPAGVSSTVRRLSAAKARISTTSSDQAPEASALPARLAPKGPGKTSGKMVNTLARHILPSRRNHNPPGGNIDDRHVRLVERDQFGLSTSVGLHLDQITGAKIMDGDHGAETFARWIKHREANQVGVIKLIGLLRLRQAFARHVELDLAQLFGRVAIA